MKDPREKTYNIVDCQNCDGKGIIDYDLGEDMPYKCGSCNGLGKEIEVDYE